MGGVWRRGVTVGRVRMPEGVGCAMRLVPIKTVKKIQFFLTREGPWADRAGAIGTSPAAVAALAGKVALARARLAEQAAAYQSARNATAALRFAVADMERTGADIVKQIRAK